MNNTKNGLIYDSLATIEELIDACSKSNDEDIRKIAEALVSVRANFVKLLR